MDRPSGVSSGLSVSKRTVSPILPLNSCWLPGGKLPAPEPSPKFAAGAFFSQAASDAVIKTAIRIRNLFGGRIQICLLSHNLCANNDREIVKECLPTSQFVGPICGLL